MENFIIRQKKISNIADKCNYESGLIYKLEWWTLFGHFYKYFTKELYMQCEWEDTKDKQEVVKTKCYKLHN